MLDILYKFTSMFTGNSIVIRFNMAVDSERDIICVDVLDDISRLGDAPTCRFNVNKDTLTVRFGDLPMLTPGWFASLAPNKKMSE